MSREGEDRQRERSGPSVCVTDHVETRARKIREFVEMLERNEKIHETRKTRRESN
jgi:hypothetical protein